MVLLERGNWNQCNENLSSQALDSTKHNATIWSFYPSKNMLIVDWNDGWTGSSQLRSSSSRWLPGLAEKNTCERRQPCEKHWPLLHAENAPRSSSTYQSFGGKSCDWWGKMLVDVMWWCHVYGPWPMGKKKELHKKKGEKRFRLTWLNSAGFWMHFLWSTHHSRGHQEAYRKSVLFNSEKSEESWHVYDKFQPQSWDTFFGNHPRNRKSGERSTQRTHVVWWTMAHHWW